MRALRLIKSPTRFKKFRVIFEDGDTVDFGQKGYSDFTLHKNPLRMRSYLIRHGAAPYMTDSVKKSKNTREVERRLLKISNSHLENWKISGIKTPGFWSRWLLWSKPSLSDAQRVLTSKFNIRFI